MSSHMGGARTIMEANALGTINMNEASCYTKHCAIKRFGYVEEIANLFAFCASDKCGYLTGVDILCDGGCVASGCSPLRREN